MNSPVDSEPAPVLTVLLPVRNGKATLACALTSLLRQTFGDFEIIVVMALPALFHGDYVRVPLKFDGNKMKSVLERAIGSVAALGVTTEAFAESSRALVRKIRWRQLDYRLGGLPWKMVKGRIGVRTRALVRQFAGKHQS